ncbi:MAG: hypothetical protein SFU53_15090 [Terrimicrobiaceae bacterium]|nr:hypothetical protein [Terrimicrobiaceae bacterium]
MKIAIALVLSLLPLAAQATVTAADFPGALPVLVGLDPIQSDLSLTNSQKRQVEAIRSDFRKQARAIVRQAGHAPSDPAAAEAKLAALKEKSNARVLQLLTPAQLSRLKEIQHQVLGSTMLVSPTVQKALDLTHWQVGAIDKIRRKGVEYVGRVNSWYHDGEISQSDRLELLRDRRVRQARAMELLLSPAQRRTLEAMQGRPLRSS